MYPVRPLASFKTPLLSVIASSPGAEQATMTGAEEVELAAGAADEDAAVDTADEDAEEEVEEEAEDTGAGAAVLVATEAGLLAFVVAGEEAGVDGATVGAWG
jgi:hypothetical protein